MTMHEIQKVNDASILTITEPLSYLLLSRVLAPKSVGGININDFIDHNVYDLKSSEYI